MEFILHRINTIRELENTPDVFGVELDLRDRGSRLILQHDPFLDGEDFERYLDHYRHGTMIVNVKSEGLENRALELLNQRGITNFFFLDSSFPMIVRLGARGESRLAIRISEYESMDTAKAAAGMVQWVWIDCFTKFPLDAQMCDTLKNIGYKICIVSPELQSRKHDVAPMASLLRQQGIAADAICTKPENVEVWRRALGC